MIIKTSASMLKGFNVCPKIVYHRRHKTPTPKSASMLVGSLIHDMIDDEESKGGIDADAYSARMIRELSSGGNIEFRSWQTIPALTRLVNNCYENYLSIRDFFPPIVSTEAEFNLETSINVFMVGRWDQLREENVIVELKSSRREPSKEFLAADIQATFYIWVYKELFGVTPTYYYVHLPTGNVYEVFRKDYTDLLVNINDYVVACASQHYPKYKDGYKCDNCFYKQACLTENEGCQLISSLPKKPKLKKPASKFF